VKNFPRKEARIANVYPDIRIIETQSGRFSEKRKQGKDFNSSRNILERQEKIPWTFVEF
jgi:hypothetical protein